MSQFNVLLKIREIWALAVSPQLESLRSVLIKDLLQSCCCVLGNSWLKFT